MPTRKTAKQPNCTWLRNIATGHQSQSNTGEELCNRHRIGQRKSWYLLEPSIQVNIVKPLPLLTSRKHRWLSLTGYRSADKDVSLASTDVYQLWSLCILHAKRETLRGFSKDRARQRELDQHLIHRAWRQPADNHHARYARPVAPYEC